MHVNIYNKKDWMATVHLEMHRNRFIFGLLDDTVKDFYEKGPRPNKNGGDSTTKIIKGADNRSGIKPKCTCNRSQEDYTF